MAILNRRAVTAVRFCSALAVLLSCLDAPPAASAQTQWQERHIEAAFLYNLAKFVEWPADSAAAGTAPLVFCVFGAESFLSALEESLAGKAINGHTVSVREISRPEDTLNCQVAFIGWGEKKRWPAVLDTLKGSAVLTVADFEQFASHGGMIQLVKEGNKFRFTVNVDAVSRHGLRVSSRLLQLAEVVHETISGGSKP